jgi:hypothetical protein
MDMVSTFGMEMKIVRLIGYVLSLTMAYKLWGVQGYLFTLGLILGGLHEKVN